MPDELPPDLVAAAKPLVDLLTGARTTPPGGMEALGLVSAIGRHRMSGVLEAVVRGWVAGRPAARETLRRWIS